MISSFTFKLPMQVGRIIFVGRSFRILETDYHQLFDPARSWSVGPYGISWNRVGK
jgi:hypothetical protein